jgi:hypothetical protein
MGGGKMSLESLYGPDPPEPDYPECPVCGDECEEILYSINGDIVGCDHCIKKVDAWEWAAEEKKNAGPDPDRLYDEYKERESA